MVEPFVSRSTIDDDAVFKLAKAFFVAATKKSDDDEDILPQVCLEFTRFSGCCNHMVAFVYARRIAKRRR